MYKGYNLFQDVEDIELRSRNQAVVMSNIALDHRTAERTISAMGAALILGYFNSIPANERKNVFQKFNHRLEESGFVVIRH